MTVGVAIASNGRCAPLLQHLVLDWLKRGALVAVAGGDGVVKALGEGAGSGIYYGLRVIHMPDGPKHQGDQIAAAFDALNESCDFVLRTDDDIMPLGLGGWVESLPANPGTIQAVRMIDLRGRRWFDWARRTNAGAFLQDYTAHGPRTFITGGCQLWSREARAAVSYRGRPYRTGADAQICENAEAAGIQLLPPDPDGPVLVHLDRKPKHINRI